VQDYTTIDCNAETIAPAFFYLDPPYAGTKQYQNNFWHDQFYRWTRELSKHHFVLISEYQMPSDFLSMWAKERKVMQKSDRVSAELFSEHLFAHKDGLYYQWYHEDGYKLWQNR
jgi:site-specific DNA-adenine methylase